MSLHLFVPVPELLAACGDQSAFFWQWPTLYDDVQGLRKLPAGQAVHGRGLPDIPVSTRRMQQLHGCHLLEHVCSMQFQ